MSPFNAIWSPKDKAPIWLWQVDSSSCPKLLSKVPKLVPFHLIWGNDALRSIEKDKFTNSGILSMWSFGSWGCQ